MKIDWLWSLPLGSGSFHTCHFISIDVNSNKTQYEQRRPFLLHILKYINTSVIIQEAFLLKKWQLDREPISIMHPGQYELEQCRVIESVLFFSSVSAL